MLNIVGNFLEKEVIDNINQKFQDSKGKQVFEINNMGRWGAGLESGSYAPVFILNLDEYKDYFIQKYKTVDPIFKDYNNLTVYLHVWPPGSQINFHHDHDERVKRLSSTIYINERWNWNWGGFFIADDPHMGQRWVYPQYNTMVWFEPPVWHSTSMVTLLAEFPRLSIQLFFTQ